MKGYDYGQAGAYFLTICVQIVQCAWNDLANHISDIGLGEFVIMPNHIHGIVVIATSVSAGCVGAGSKPAQIPSDASTGAGLEPAPTKCHGLPEIVRQFKTFSARRINENRHALGMSVWQRNYYEHIIRNEADYNRIAKYIADNPRKWPEDSLHPDNVSVGAGPQPAHEGIRTAL